MASSSVLVLAYTLCSLLCIFSLQTEVLGVWSGKLEYQAYSLEGRTLCLASSSYHSSTTLLITVSNVSFKAIELAAVNLTYYLQEIRGGPGTNGTIFAAAGTNDTSMVGWGTILIFDSPLHEGPSSNSTLLGKSTGTATVTNIGGIPDGGVQIYCQHIYNNASMYYKSSITILGQVDFATGTPPWECIVPGGTGYFRGYKGYGLAELMTAADAAIIVYKWSIFLTK